MKKSQLFAMALFLLAPSALSETQSDLHHILRLAELPAQNLNGSWHIFSSFEAFEENFHQNVATPAQACEERSGQDVKKYLSNQFTYYFDEKADLQAVMDAALDEQRFYRACFIDHIELDRPHAPDVVASNFVYTIIDAVAGKEVAIGLYVEYY